MRSGATGAPAAAWLAPPAPPQTTDPQSCCWQTGCQQRARTNGNQWLSLASHAVAAAAGSPFTHLRLVLAPLAQSGEWCAHPQRLHSTRQGRHIVFLCCVHPTPARIEPQHVLVPAAWKLLEEERSHLAPAVSCRPSAHALCISDAAWLQGCWSEPPRPASHR